MGCNCKKKFDKLKEYSDEPTHDGENKGIIFKFFLFFVQLFFGILLAPLIIVITIPFIIYVIICIMFGIEPNVILKIPFKKGKQKQ